MIIFFWWKSFRIFSSVHYISAAGRIQERQLRNTDLGADDNTDNTDDNTYNTDNTDNNTDNTDDNTVNTDNNDNNTDNTDHEINLIATLPYLYGMLSFSLSMFTLV